jgi:hypothetical protein
MWIAFPDIAKSCPELKCCGCKIGWITKRCRCMKDDIPCTALCGCDGTCSILQNTTTNECTELDIDFIIELHAYEHKLRSIDVHEANGQNNITNWIFPNFSVCQLNLYAQFKKNSFAAIWCSSFRNKPTLYQFLKFICLCQMKQILGLFHSLLQYLRF